MDLAPSLVESRRPARQSTGEQAASYIRRLIFEGVLEPGTRIPQDEVAEALGISRIPVREGLIALEREGWVTIEMNRGAFVAALDARAVRDHFELYGLLYGFAVKRAMSRDDASLVERLAPLQRAIAAADDADAMFDAVIRFQSAVVDSAASPRIRVVLRAASTMVPGNFFAAVPDAIPLEKRGLAAIFRAIKQGDADLASDRYLTLMQRVGEEVVELFQLRGLFAELRSEGVAAESPAR